MYLKRLISVDGQPVNVEPKDLHRAGNDQKFEPKVIAIFLIHKGAITIRYVSKTISRDNKKETKNNAQDAKYVREMNGTLNITS